jgi:hypothetical protein
VTDVANMYVTCFPSSGPSTTPSAVGDVGQDYLRRIVLRERDVPGGNAAALIAQPCTGAGAACLVIQ